MKIKKIARGIVGFVGGFAIGCASVLALQGFQMLVNKAFDEEPDCIRDATGLENYGSEPEQYSEDEIAIMSGYIPYEDGGY